MLNVLARRLPPMLGIAVSMPLIVLLLVLGFFLLLTAIAVVGTQAFSPTATAWSVVASGLVGVALLSSIAVVYCMFFVAAPVCIAEQAGIRTSFSRSRFLTKGHRWQIFGAFILIFVVGLIANVAAAVLASRMGAGTQGLIMSYLVQAVFIAFNAVVAAVFYHQLRVAKHGIDIANIANVFD